MLAFVKHNKPNFWVIVMVVKFTCQRGSARQCCKGHMSASDGKSLKSTLRILFKETEHKISTQGILLVLLLIDIPVSTRPNPLQNIMFILFAWESKRYA
jgi:hypothetical protein